MIPELPNDCHEMTGLVAAYWLSIHPGGQQLPGRSHFDPIDLLPSIWPSLILSDVLREPFDIRYRFFGSKVVALFGADKTGKKFSEAPPRRDPELARADYCQAIETKRPQFRRVPVFDGLRGFNLLIERTHFPLAEDGSTVDMILTSFVQLDRHEAH